MNDLSRRQFLHRAAMLGGGIALPTCSGDRNVGAAKKVTGPVRWLSWSVYDHPEIRTSFEKEHGVSRRHVEIIPINDNGEAFGKLKVAGTGAYDTIGADGLWCWEYYRNKFIEPFDMSEFSTTPELFPEFASYNPWRVPDGRFLQFPSAASPYTIWYSKDKVDMPDPPSFEVLFDPKYKGKVALRDSFSRNFMVTASMMGFEDFEVDTPDGQRWHLPDDVLKRAKDELIRAKPNFKFLWRSSGDVSSRN